MLQNRIQFTDDSQAVNFNVQHGSSLPTSGENTGELFFVTGANGGLFIFDGSNWVSTGAGLAAYTITGDLAGTMDSGGAALSLQTVNSNVGSFGSSSSIPVVTTDAKGRVTSISTVSLNGFDPSSSQTVSGAWTFSLPVSGGMPSASSDFATKGYIDSLLAGLLPKEPVRAASTANIVLSGLQTIDGVAVQSGDRVLVKNQTTASQNGVYIVSSSSWVRSSDFDGSPSVEVAAGDFVYVLSGSSNGGTGWSLLTSAPVIGSAAIEFTQVQSTGSRMNGSGAPSSISTGVFGSLATSASWPIFWLGHASATTNQHWWSIAENETNAALIISSWNDAFSARANPISITRSGTTPSTTFAATAVSINGSLTSTGTMAATSFVGDGSSLTLLNGAAFTSGTMPTARLGSGAADSTKFLCGDGTWTYVDPNQSAVTSVGFSGGSTGLTFSGSPITISGTATMAGTLGIAYGGTNATSSTTAINNLVPSQSTKNGQLLSSDGSAVSWAALTGADDLLTGTSDVSQAVVDAVVNTVVGGSTAYGPSTFFYNASATTGNKTAGLFYTSGGSLVYRFTDDNSISAAVSSDVLNITRVSGSNNTDSITFTAGTPTITGISLTATDAGSPIAFSGAPGGSTSGDGGAINITGGISSASSSGGTVTIRGGSSLTGSPGTVSITGGSSDASQPTGDVIVRSGNGVGITTGNTNVVSGNVLGAGVSGSVSISTGTTVQSSSGQINISSGSSSGTSSTSGTVSVYSGYGSGSGSSGAVSVGTGSGGSSGWIDIRSGLSNTVNAGNVTIRAGSSTNIASGTGHIYIQTAGAANSLTLRKSGFNTLNYSAAQNELLAMQANAGEVGTSQYLMSVNDNTTAVSGTSRVNRGLAVRTNVTDNVLSLISTSNDVINTTGYSANNPLAIVSSAGSPIEIARFVASHHDVNNTSAVLINKTIHSQNGVLQVAGDSEIVGKLVIASSQPSNGTSASTLGQLDARSKVDVNNTNTTLRVRATSATTASLHLQNATTGTTVTDGTKINIETTGVDASIWNYESGSLSFGTSNVGSFSITSTGAWSINSSYGTSGQVLKADDNGVPYWGTFAATSIANLTGGAIGRIPYQTAADTTAFLATSTSGYLLQCNGAAAPTWVVAPTTVAGSAVTGTALASTVVSSSLTSVGTLASLTVSGAATLQGTSVSSIAPTGSVSFTQYTEPVNNIPVTTDTTIDCSAGNTFIIDLQNDGSISFANVPDSTKVYNVTFVVIQGGATGSYALGWPSSVKWASGSAPSITAGVGSIDVVTMTTVDGGTKWMAGVAGQNFY